MSKGSKPVVHEGVDTCNDPYAIYAYRNSIGRMRYSLVVHTDGESCEAELDTERLTALRDALTDELNRLDDDDG